MFSGSIFLPFFHEIVTVVIKKKMFLPSQIKDCLHEQTPEQLQFIKREGKKKTN